jgi:hypothetical protein
MQRESRIVRHNRHDEVDAAYRLCLRASVSGECFVNGTAIEIEPINFPESTTSERWLAAVRLQ